MPGGKMTDPAPKAIVMAMPHRPDGQKVTTPAGARYGAFAGQWWLVSGFWLLLTLAVVLADSLEYPYDITHGLNVAGSRWLPWVFLTPAISWLTSHYRLQWTSWPRTIGIYLVACALVIIGMGVLAYYANPDLRNEGRNNFRRDHDNGFEHSRSPHGRERFPQEATPGRFPGGPKSPGRDGRSNSLRLIQVASIQLPTFWLVVLALHGLHFYQQAKERERHEAELESSLVLARLQALRMQLNPHFLFNTLNSIASLVYENPKAADDMIGSLSELLRLTLNSTDRQEAALREELHLLDLYLRIEQERFGERLKLRKEIDPAALDAIVPILVLQPLAENAVKHGLESQLGPGLVSVVAKRAGNDLLLQVADNGRGPMTNEEGNVKEGVGLGNTRARLQALYGDKGSMEIREPDSGGCLVEIKIPWRTVFGMESSGTTRPKA